MRSHGQHIRHVMECPLCDVELATVVWQIGGCSERLDGVCDVSREPSLCLCLNRQESRANATEAFMEVGRRGSKSEESRV